MLHVGCAKLFGLFVSSPIRLLLFRCVGEGEGREQLGTGQIRIAARLRLGRDRSGCG